MGVLLEVSGLKTYFRTRRGPVRAVDDVSFTVNSGEIIGIVGESGSGKSVTALSVMRLIEEPGEIVGGKISFAGQDLLQLSDEEMRRLRGERIAMIFQDPGTSLNPVLSIRFQLEEAIRSHQQVSKAEARERARSLLAQVGIADPGRRLRQFPHQFSGGMLQRMMIAMALACQPALLIADEPVTALDVTIQAQILDLLMQLRDETGASVLLITHDMGVVAETCDRVVVMYLGKIVEKAPVWTLFDGPKHPYTAGLLQSIPSLDRPIEQLSTIPGHIPSPFELPAGCRFCNRCDQVMDVCREVEPPFVEVAPHHFVACHLYADGGEQR